MVLVRKSELACRNGWDQDLWEAKAGSPDRRPTPTGASPGSPALANGAMGEDERERTDTLASVSIARTPRPNATAPASRIDAPRMDPPGPAAHSVAHSQPSGPAQAPAASNARGFRSQQSTQETGRAERSQNSPPPSPWEPRERITQHAAIGSRAVDEPAGASNRVGASPQRTPPLRSGSPIGARPATTGGAPEPSQRTHLSTTDPGMRQPAPRLSNEPPSGGRRGIEARSTVPAKRGSDPQRGLRSGSTDPFELVDPSASVAAVSHPAARPQADERAEVEPVADEQEMVVEANSRRGPRSIAVEQMPRCCATCRDFRPADGGKMGWCNNPYAFGHRQMVKSDGLACASTIGNWWVPNDDWWMQRADISHHGRPTPAVDEFLHRLLVGRLGSRRREARS